MSASQPVLGFAEKVIIEKRAIPKASADARTEAPADQAYRPRTNAERFIGTMLGGWAHGAIYHDCSQRTAALNGWLEECNYQPPHACRPPPPPDPPEPVELLEPPDPAELLELVDLRLVCCPTALATTAAR